MMTNRMVNYFPCATFFRTGHTGSGLLALVMQLSVVFWPSAIRMAREHGEKLGVQKMLTHFSEIYRVPSGTKYAASQKKFSQPGLAG